MRSLLLVTTLALATAGWTQSGSSAAFDPVGKWTYSTRDEQGAQTSGTMTIAGKPGAYTGTIVTAENQELPVTDVYTSSTGMVVMASIGDGATAVIKVSKKPDGKLETAWAPVRNVIPVTLERAK